ncbi:uncharacterized protein B0H64DRAFT_462914 [Chaetomium fimeti]|uniref:Rhodopsin domain-containing protein n=1 Tax=Chaetomium fimeti TaxID=1854472 RepID=A0AAE0HD31_9PEZI|nr:hypothetical protein B0H64DRAFT_462914 [Chaetomium fimeti]
MSSGSPAGPGGASGTPMAELDHDDLGPNILAANYTTWAIAVIFVLLRFWTRVRIVRSLGPADWFIAASVIAAGCMCISQAEQVKYGKGKHIWDIDMDTDWIPQRKAWWFSLLCYILTLFLTKVSICLLYLTIFTLEWARRACYGVLAIVIITNLWAIATTLTYCIPLEAAWDSSIEASFCQGQDAWWANTGIIVVTDLMIFILPIPIIAPLKLPRRQKLVVVGIFAIGFFVCLVSLIRLAILIQVKNAADPDSTYTNTDLVYWTCVEVNTAIVVACAMTLRPLVTRFWPRLFDSRGSSGGDGAGGGGGGGGSSGGVSGGGHGPPLTIGSKPSRMQGGKHGVEGVGIGIGIAEVDGDGGGNARAGLAYGPSPWVKGDGASERMEDLGREATARSIG